MYHLAHKVWRHFKTDPLFENSVYLMLTSGVMALLGFLFWLLCAHFFTPSQIGVATTLISTLTLISYVSLLGFNNTFIRFLPKSENRSAEINTGLLLTSFGAIVLSITFIFAIPYFESELDLLEDHILYAFGFTVIAVCATLNLLTDSIFVALRSAKYNLLVDGFILSGVKLCLPFVFLGFGAYGVFAASGAATAIAAVVSIYFLIAHFGYRPSLKISVATLQKVAHYSTANYIANILNIAPTLLLPLIVFNNLGSAAAGYYYLAFTIANLLYAVVYATSQSLFAEGSYADEALRDLVRKTVIFIGSTLIPGSIALFLLAPYILHVFGKGYSTEAVEILKIFALSAPLVAIYIISNLVLRIKKHTYLLIVTNVLYVGSIWILALTWVDNGLVWVGYAWLAGNGITGLANLLLLALL